MANKSKKEIKKIYREKYKALWGEYPEPKFLAGNGLGKMPKLSKWIVNGKRRITNQKGAFGKRKEYTTFDPNETNKMRYNKMKAKKDIEKSIGRKITEGARGLLAKTLGE